MRIKSANQTPSTWARIGTVASLKLDGTRVVPAQKFRKAIIKVGEYVKLSDGIRFAVEPATLDHWVATFAEMSKNGVRVPIPDSHRTAGASSHNAGWVDALEVEGDTLYMSCTIIGSDMIETASRNDVSIYCPAVHSDGKGNRYDRPIEHVALTPVPVVPGLGDFIPIAASAEFNVTPSGMQLETLQTIGAALGLNPDLIEGDENGLELILNAIKAQTSETLKMAKDNKPADDATKTKETPAPKAEEKKVETTTEPPVAASNEATKPSPILVKTVIDNRTMKIDRLAEHGKIIPAVATQLKTRFANAETVSLSLSNNSDGSDFDSMISAFEANDPVVKLGSTTGPQTNKTVALSDDRKGGDGVSPLVADAERRAAAAKGK